MASSSSPLNCTTLHFIRSGVGWLHIYQFRLKWTKNFHRKTGCGHFSCRATHYFNFFFCVQKKKRCIITAKMFSAPTTTNGAKKKNELSVVVVFLFRFRLLTIKSSSFGDGTLLFWGSILIRMDRQVSSYVDYSVWLYLTTYIKDMEKSELSDSKGAPFHCYKDRGTAVNGKKE